MSAFRYERPPVENAKLHVPIGHSDIMYCAVQVIQPGGRTNLHSHTGMDGLWFVLSGRVRFHGAEGPVGEFERNEGVFVPRGTPYWFENPGDSPAEILQAEAIDRRGCNRRIDHEPRAGVASAVRVIKSASRPL